MTLEQLTDQMLQQNREIAALQESLKSAHKRIDENDRITEGIHKLATNIETLTLQVKLLTESMESSVARLEKSLKNQSERISALEMGGLTIGRNEKSITALANRVDALEKEPATKWKDLVKQIIAIVVAAVVGAVTGKFTK